MVCDAVACTAAHPALPCSTGTCRFGDSQRAPFKNDCDSCCFPRCARREGPGSCGTGICQGGLHGATVFRGGQGDTAATNSRQTELGQYVAELVRTPNVHQCQARAGVIEKEAHAKDISNIGRECGKVVHSEASLSEALSRAGEPQLPRSNTQGLSNLS